MQTYYRCEEGFEARAEQVTTKACKKLITDMHHEVRIQAIVTYYRSKLGESVRKMDPKPIYFEFWCLMTNTTKLD